MSWTWEHALQDLNGSHEHDLLLLGGTVAVLLGLSVVLFRAVQDRNRLFDLSPYPVCILDTRGVRECQCSVAEDPRSR